MNSYRKRMLLGSIVAIAFGVICFLLSEDLELTQKDGFTGALLLGYFGGFGSAFLAISLYPKKVREGLNAER